MKLKIFERAEPKQINSNLWRARHGLLFDRDPRHSGRQEDPDLNHQYTHAYHPAVGIPF
jgi:hypothetical protein